LGADPATEKYGSLLARWAGDGDIKGKTENDLLGSKTASNIKNHISTNPNVTQFLSSIAASGASPTQIDGVLHSINSLAFALKYYGKADDAANAPQIAADAITSKYEFMPNGGARVPKENMDAVSKNAQFTLNHLEDIAATPDVYNTGHSGAPKPAEYFAMVKAAPTWVTSRTGDAIVLKNNMDRFVLGKDGKPITIPFDKLAPETATPSPANLLGGTGGL
jgi:hypothetical protein